MTQKRTTKALASRIQADYLTKRLPLRYWKRTLAAVFAVCAIAWGVFGFSFQPKQHMPGPLISGHQMFGDNCASCHQNGFQKIENDACLECHKDHPHHTEQKQTPDCVSCHVEHSKKSIVSGMEPASCAQCHSSLTRKDGKETSFEKSISSLETNHPNWKGLEELKTKPALLLLNHQVHLKPNLKGPNETYVSLVCSDCHASDKNDPHGISKKAPITFGDHCERCHNLGFDPQFPDAKAPHKKSSEVQEFVQDFYQTQLQNHPDLPKITLPRDFAGPKKRSVATSPELWLLEKTKQAQTYLFKEQCQLCHVVSNVSEGLPEIDSIKLFEFNLDEGKFDHHTHRAMDCAQCHTQAPNSEKSEDILIPGVDSCISCHSKNGMAGAACSTCHVYHDAKEK